MFFNFLFRNKQEDKLEDMVNNELIAHYGYLEAENESLIEKTQDIIQQNVAYEVENLEFEQRLDEIEDSIDDLDNKIDEFDDRLDYLEEQMWKHIGELEETHDSTQISPHKKDETCKRLKSLIKELKEIRKERYLQIKMM